MLGMEEEQLEYSSGCESGWTMYLLHSSCGRSSPSEKANVGLSCGSNEDQDGDDMSMMSDASSGPALLHEDGSFLQGKSGFASASSSLVPTRKSESSRSGTSKSEQEKRLPWMDDTASSYAVSFSKTSKEMKWESSSISSNKEETVEDALEFSLGLSSTHLMDKPSREKQYRFFQSALPGQPTSNIPVKLTKIVSKEVNRDKVW